MNLQDFLARLEVHTGNKYTKSGSGYSTLCPAHNDHNPSLSVSENQKGDIILHCFKGCPPESVCSALSLELKDLFNSVHSHPIRTSYIYQDEQGREIYRKIRIEPGLNGKSKDFYFERIDEHGNRVKNLKGCRRVLYRLPDILKAIAENAIIFLVEGEKDADKLHQLGLTATTTIDSLHWPDEFSELLKGANVVILYDMDKTGFKRRDLLCEKLSSIVKQLRIVDLPGLQYQDSHGADISDWLAMGHTTKELLEIVEKTPLHSPSQEKSKIRGVSLGEFLTMTIPDREMLLGPFLPSQGLAMLYAKRGVGKTLVALGIAGAVAQGGTFLKWSAPKPRRVLYIDGEMPAIAMQERLRYIFSETADLKIHENLTLITPDLQESPMPDLSTESGRESIEEYVKNHDLIIVDNLSCLFRSGKENEADSWQPAQDWALELRKRGKSILFIHHAGKSGTSRGTSKREDILDTVILLKHPNDYRHDQGARFEVHYEKTRHFSGEEAISFSVQLRNNEKAKLWTWEITGKVIDPEVEIVATLTKQGRTISQIMEEAKLSKSQVESRRSKGRELGLIE